MGRPGGLFRRGGNPEVDMIIVGADIEQPVPMVHIVVMPVPPGRHQLWLRVGPLQRHYAYLGSLVVAQRDKQVLAGLAAGKRQLQ